MREGASLFAVALTVQLLWCLTVDGPSDMDAQYYLVVARNLAGGEGAVTAGLWSAAWLPEQLPMLADTYWMPLPSRAIVPEIALFPSASGTWTSAVIAASMAPIAALLAEDLGAERWAARGAAAIVALGGLYARLLVMPDTYALYGLLGAVALLGIARDRWGWVAAAVFLAGLTRTDGLLLALAAAAGARTLGTAAIAVGSGIAASVLWTVRTVALGGADALAMRQLALRVGEYVHLFDGTRAPTVGVVERVSGAVAAIPETLAVWAGPGFGVLTLPAIWAVWRYRDRPWVRSLAMFAVLSPVLAWLAAPAVAGHGTLYRGMTALLAGHGALAAVGVAAATAWSVEEREYPRWFLPTALGLAFAGVTVFKGLDRAWNDGRAPNQCELVQDLPPNAVIFTAEPLALEMYCDRVGILLTNTMSPEQVADVVQRYGVVAAIPATEGRSSIGLTPEQMAERFPTWERNDGVFRVDR